MFLLLLVFRKLDVDYICKDCRNCIEIENVIFVYIGVEVIVMIRMIEKGWWEVDGEG